MKIELKFRSIYSCWQEVLQDCISKDQYQQIEESLSDINLQVKKSSNLFLVSRIA